MKKTFILTIIAVLCFSSCENLIPDEDPVPRKEIELTKSQMEFVQTNNGFALDLFRQVAKEGEGKNLLISPLSVTIDFGMVNNGAVGKTQQEIYETLGYKEDSVEGLNTFCQMMMEQSATLDPSVTLEIANAAVVNKMYPGLKDSFTRTVKSFYDAEVIYKDFGKEDIKGLVNDWCDRKTHGMIPELLTRPVEKSEYAHFLNAVYFKGQWTSKFKKSDTKKDTFTLEDGTKTSVKMMHQKDQFNYGSIPGLCTALSLPYGNQAYCMTLLLPDKGKTLAGFIDEFDVSAWNQLWMSAAEVDVKIPSFETEYFVSLKDILPGMGIRLAFGDGADFSAMSSTPDLFIADVLHKARIKVDEEGSEAAAVTDITIGFAMADPVTAPVPSFEFRAEWPFIYVITEISTGAIYFIGQYTGK